MAEQVQFFQIGNLIFSTPDDKNIILSSDEIKEIQRRFQSIVDSFQTSETYYTTGFFKGTNTRLPYTSMTVVGEVKDHLVLYFGTTYKNSVLFVIDTRKNVARNYIDIETAKSILDDAVFKDIKDELHFPKVLDRLFKHILDMGAFIEKYQAELDKHNNDRCVTGRECFELEL